MPHTNQRKDLFDKWAGTYDADLRGEEAFPFLGYDAVLQSIVKRAEIQPAHRVLDVGIGTGNLASRLNIPDEQIWGLDFSSAMLEKAQLAHPGAHLVQADLTREGWLEKLDSRFDRILSSYTFHEFPDAVKVEILKKMASYWLKEGGLIIIGDISFQNLADYHSAQERFAAWWDGDEYYWCAEALSDVLCQAGFSMYYEQVSACAGIYQLTWKGC